MTKGNVTVCGVGVTSRFPGGGRGWGGGSPVGDAAAVAPGASPSSAAREAGQVVSAKRLKSSVNCSIKQTPTAIPARLSPLTAEDK